MYTLDWELDYDYWVEWVIREWIFPCAVISFYMAYFFFCIIVTLLVILFTKWLYIAKIGWLID